RTLSSKAILESSKEPVVVAALWVIRPDPRSIDETLEYMPLEQCFHLLLELHAKLTPVTALPRANATAMSARMAGHRCCVSMAFLPGFMNTTACRGTGIIKRLAVL